MSVFKMELKRSLDTVGMKIAVFMGLIIACYNKYTVLSRIYNSIRYCKEMGIELPYAGFQKLTFYSYWIVSAGESAIFYLIYFVGLMVALPYGVSYYSDNKNGIIKNICTRTDKGKYLRSKYLATFISGGIVSVIPLFFDFCLSKLCVPVDYIRVQGTALRVSNEWGVFVVDHIYLAAVIYMILWFVFGGALTTVSLLTSVLTDNFFTVQLMPFFIMLIVYYLPNVFSNISFKWIPLYFLTYFGASTPVYGFMVTAIIMIITFGGFYIREKRRDVL